MRLLRNGVAVLSTSLEEDVDDREDEEDVDSSLSAGGGVELVLCGVGVCRCGLVGVVLM